MKFVYSFLAVSLLSVSSYACPNLSGSWTCRSAEGDVVSYLTLDSINTLELNLLIRKSSIGNVKQSEVLYLNVGKRASDLGDSYVGLCTSKAVILKTTGKNGEILDVVYTLLSRNNMKIDTYTSSIKSVNCTKIAYDQVD